MLFYILLGITGLFFLVLLVKSMLKNKKICAICLSVSLTWIILLSFYFLGIFTDKTLIAILMGQTSIGLFYFFNEKLNVFKLPFILTLVVLIYFTLEKIELNVIYLLISFWIIFTLIYLFKSNKNLRIFANKLIDCCKKW